MVTYVLVILLSAFLSFQIQPVISKCLLPWFGGTPTVWSTSLLFFQLLLLAGYAYAYWLSTHVRLRTQALMHLSIVILSCLFLVTSYARGGTILPTSSVISQRPNYPIWVLLKTLALSVGAPYLILSTTSPLLQSWFSHAYPQKSPYVLYSYSNAGSLLALITYPFLIEPLLSLKTQALLWSGGYLISIIGIGYCATQVARAQNIRQETPSSPTVLAAGPSKGRALLIRVLWVAFPACASVLLFATTRQISQEIAVVPFLWILPLTLYLLSFVLCFAQHSWYSRRLCIAALLFASGLFCWVMTRDFSLNIAIQILVYCVVFFVCCMICHGEVVRLRPDPCHLTAFYLSLAAGGALGGVFATLIAPVIYTGYYELQVGVLLCWALLLITITIVSASFRTQRYSFVTAALLMTATAFVALYCVLYIRILSNNDLAAFRNFYGVLRVREVTPDGSQDKATILMHGATIHGLQYQGARRSEATAYFTADSGIGFAFAHHPKHPVGLRVAVLGLGIGTLAAYGRPRDKLRFYEINPDVVRLARGEGGYFRYLRDSAAPIEIVPGDARISLMSELVEPSHPKFDLMVMDAFNSDSVPVHLLTKEAFEIYLAHLDPEGILAFNISNRYLDLRPVLSKLAKHFRLDGGVIETARYADGRYPSTWILLTRSPKFMAQLYIATHLRLDDKAISDIRLWTDDYSNVVQILR